MKRKSSDGSVISSYDYSVNAIGQRRKRVDHTGSALSAPDPANAQHASVLSYPTYDGNGNVSEYLNSTSATVAHYEQCESASILDRSVATCPKGQNTKHECFDQYDAFGNEIFSKTSGAKANDFAHRFSTKPLDQETGFYYYGYRYYDPETGRWSNRDPLADEQFLKDYLSNHDIKGYSNIRKLESAQMGNIYSMLNNDPLNDYDPLGLQGGKKEECCGGKKVKIGNRETCCDGDVKSKKTCNCEKNGGKWVQRRNCPSHWCYDPLLPPAIPAALAGAQVGGQVGKACAGTPGSMIGAVIRSCWRSGNL